MIPSHIGPYKVVRHLGSGGSGEVYCCSSNLLVDLAVKVMHASDSKDPAKRERFLSDAQTMAKLKHPNIVDVKTLHDEAVPYFTMELVAGAELADIIKRQGRLQVSEAVRIARETASAFSAVHDKAIYHRDIKPGNIMIRAGDGAVKVLDFSIARLEGAERMTLTGKVIGTPQYMSPEQARGLPGDRRSDIYALGCTLYEMLTGAAPFDHHGSISDMMTAHISERPRPPAELVPGLPAKVNAAILRALAKEPAKRFQSMAEFGAALELPAVEGGTGRVPAAWVLAASVVLALAVGGGILVMSSNPTSDETAVATPLRPGAATDRQAAVPKVMTSPSPARPEGVTALSVTAAPSARDRAADAQVEPSEQELFRKDRPNTNFIDITPANQSTQRSGAMEAPGQAVAPRQEETASAGGAIGAPANVAPALPANPTPPPAQVASVGGQATAPAPVPTPAPTPAAPSPAAPPAEQASAPAAVSPVVPPPAPIVPPPAQVASVGSQPTAPAPVPAPPPAPVTIVPLPPVVEHPAIPKGTGARQAPQTPPASSQASLATPRAAPPPARPAPPPSPRVGTAPAAARDRSGAAIQGCNPQLGPMMCGN